MSDKAFVLGDSLLRPVTTELVNNSNIRVIFKPGATIESLTKFLLSIEHCSPTIWENVEFVWVLVGTNNIDNYLHTWDDVRLYPFDLAGFIEKYRHMLLTISGHLRNIHTFSGGIIPRLWFWRAACGNLSSGKTILFHRNSTGSFLQARHASLVT